MPSERRFRDDGTKATRSYKPNAGDDRMNENDEDVTPFMGSLLFGVEARDPAVFASTVIVLITAALLATCIPAYRATRVDPVTALRWE